MTKLDTHKAAVQEEAQLQQEFELELCLRDYRLLETYQEGIFSKVCEMIAIGIEIEQIEKWAKRVVGIEPLIVQRIYNAAKYEKKIQVR